MNLGDYLLRDVKPEEFQELGSRQTDIVSEVMNGFNDQWKPRVEGVKVSFKYNLQRSMIGIYINKNGQDKLVVERGELATEEEAVIGILYSTLERKLDRLRLPKEEWTEAPAKISSE